MTPELYGKSEQVTRVCRLMVVLAGHTVNGLPPGELAKALDTTPSTMTRMLAQLKNEGFVEETKVGGRWRLGPKVLQITRAYEVDIARQEGELNQIKQRYSCTV
ncbi:hypothetical protein CJ010_00685 [Azoarcus sp. DD4]|uniref:helix-turn-helix domain-containing protein n=1 Tax=Azoarcus sp. DD4 TaxID=2027405 RepID=UPI00112D1B51|nr:helix-turn-helix domain-containing protein [Azoarcus sp. DD4]QDF95169.1 hypothetical protein CJ010_00685 [Azoarcus sp. DD4]